MLSNMKYLCLRHDNDYDNILLQSVRLAQKFEALVLADQRFEIPQPRNLGKFNHYHNIV
jgi:hypothetical protein